MDRWILPLGRVLGHFSAVLIACIAIGLCLHYVVQAQKVALEFDCPIGTVASDDIGPILQRAGWEDVRISQTQGAISIDASRLVVIPELPDIATLKAALAPCTVRRVDTVTEPQLRQLAAYAIPLVLLFAALRGHHWGFWSAQRTFAVRPALAPALVLAAFFSLCTLAAMRFPETAGRVSDVYSPALGLIPAYCVLAPIAEEAWFRGALMSRIASITTPVFAILASSYLFAIFHFALAPTDTTLFRFLVVLTMGIILGWTCHRCRSIWPGIGLHAINNTIAVAWGLAVRS